MPIASGFRRRVDGLCALHFNKAPPRFEPWQQSDMSIEWVSLVHGLIGMNVHALYYHVYCQSM